MASNTAGHPAVSIAVWLLAAVPWLAAAAQLPTPGPAAATGGPGAQVELVLRGSRAARAGLRDGDRVTEYAGKEVADSAALVADVRATSPGSRVALVVRRGARIRHLTLQFQRPAPQFVAAAEAVGESTVAEPQLREQLIQLSGGDSAQEPAVSVDLILTAPTALISTAFAQPRGRADRQRAAAGLKLIIAQSGWPTIAKVGVDGVQAAESIVLLAPGDPGFQAQVLSLLQPLVPKQAPSGPYASLFDHLHTPQRYQTQIDCAGGTVRLSKPLEDPAHLDERRSRLGLKPQPAIIGQPCTPVALVGAGYSSDPGPGAAPRILRAAFDGVDTGLLFVQGSER